MVQTRGKHWTTEEEERLKTLLLAGKSSADIASDLGRTRHAVSSRAYSLGISLQKLPGNRRLSIGDDSILQSLDDEWRTVSQVRARLRMRSAAGWLAGTLRRMAKAGTIEMRATETKAPRPRESRLYSIEYFRRRSSVESSLRGSERMNRDVDNQRFN